MQVGLYITPIMWLPSRLDTEHARLILNFNPFYHLMSVIRDPLLGNTGSLLNWGVAAAMTIIGWAIALLFFNRFRSRVTYWL